MKAVIFDMDGVLVDSMKYHIKAWKLALAESGIDVDETFLSKREGQRFENTVKDATALNDKNNVDVSKIHTRKNEILNNIFKLKKYPNIDPILNILKKENKKLAVVTGSHKAFAQNVIENNFENVFEVLVCSEDTQEGKPNPQPYLKALKKLNLNYKDCLVVENAPLGILSAKRSKIKVIALETTLSENHLIGADIILKNHLELLDYFKKNITKEYINKSK